MQLVEFTNSSPPYNKGETAGFSAERAADFVEGGVAKLTSKPKRRPDTRKPVVHKTVVHFVESMPPYCRDETAGFAKGRAAELVAAGVARSLTDDEQAKLSARSKATPPPIKNQAKG